MLMYRVRRVLLKWFDADSSIGTPSPSPSRLTVKPALASQSAGSCSRAGRGVRYCQAVLRLELLTTRHTSPASSKLIQTILNFSSYLLSHPTVEASRRWRESWEVWRRFQVQE